MIRILAAALIAIPMLDAKVCSDGVHEQISIAELKIRYSGLSIRTAFDAIAHMGIEVNSVQTAGEETQRVNQYLQALAAGFNNCAITKAEYLDATRLILPQAKQDFAAISSLRQQLALGQKESEKHIKDYITRYLSTLGSLAKVVGSTADVERLEREVTSLREKVSDLEQQNDERRKREQELEARRRTAPDVEATLEPVDKTNIDLVVKAKNNIPFSFKYSIENGAFMLGFEPIYPPTDPYVFRIRVPLTLPQSDYRVRINFDFVYKSMSYDELHLPGHVGGFKRKYWLSPDGTSWVRPELGPNDFESGEGAHAIALDGKHVWVANPGEPSLTEHDTASGSVIKTYQVGNSPWNLCFDGTNIWVTDYNNNELLRLNAEGGSEIKRYHIGPAPMSMVCHDSTVWVATPFTVERLRWRDDDTLKIFSVPPTTEGLAFDGKSLWVLNPNHGTVARLDGETGVTLASFTIGSNPRALALDGSSLWVAKSGDGSVLQIDAESGKAARNLLTDTVGATALCVNSNYLWISQESGWLTKVRKFDGTVVERVRVGRHPFAIACDESHAWVANLQSGSVSRR